MITRLQQKDGKRIFFIFCIVAVAAYLVWTTTHFVLAFNETKHVHVFPTSATALGWERKDNTLVQDLPSTAPLGSFSLDNSAYVTIDTPAPAVGGGALPVMDTGTGQSVVSTDTNATTSPDTIATSTANPTPASVTQPASGPADQSTILEVSPTAASPPADTTVPDSKPPPPPPTPPPTVPDKSGSSTVQSMTNGLLHITLKHIQEYAVFALSKVVATASASTTGEIPAVDASSTSVLPTTATTSTTEVLPETQVTDTVDTSASTTNASPSVSSGVVNDPSDVATCTVLSEECHTIQLSGFNVGGSLKDKKFQGAELKFSFGASVPENSPTDGKLQVRYYHNGQWKSAGEIYLNKELSNGANGGYFSAKLDTINGWDDLSDVKVVLEYVRGQQNPPIKLYLDAVWIDTIYKEHAQDILSGAVSDTLDDAPDNVVQSLVGHNTDATLLVEDDGSHIAFPYLDNLNEDQLMIRADKQRYHVSAPGEPQDVYVSVTNTGSDADAIRLYTSFPGGKGTVRSVSRYVHDIPQATTTPVYKDVTYLCDGGWETAFGQSLDASSASEYQCAATGETHLCSSLNDTSNNCLVANDLIGVSTSTIYTSGWIDMSVDHNPPGNRAVDDGLPDGYMIAGATDESLAIAPGQTVYLKFTIDTPDSDSQRFVVSAVGGTYVGDLDSLHLKSAASWQLETKAKQHLKRPEHNNLLSTQTDFSIDEQPQFHFKWNTQRGVLTRLADFFLRRDVSFKVAKVELQHAGGSIEHEPVDIEYDANNEWTLKLESQTRAFRPGRYTAVITVDEGDATYQDQVDFYWGVLAVNPDKALYESGETAHFSIAALDDSGDTMCDAQLSLSVMAPDGTSSDVPVISGGGCGHNNVTDLPDYVADLPVSKVGAYTLTLSHANDNGDIINTTTDTFSVKKDAPFSITRTGPTRIYPPSSYKMHVMVSSRTAFNGTVTEAVPEGFTVSEALGAQMTRADGAIYISWHISLQPGETANLAYAFKAPDASPYLYLLGPLSLKDNEDVPVFREGRTWKIASDAVAIATGVAWLAGNQTTNGPSVSSTTPYALTWNLSDDYDTTYFSHSTTTNSSQLTVNVAGDYLIAVTVPVERADANATRESIETDVRVNGGKVNAGVGRAFIRTTGSVKESSAHVYMLLRNLHAGDYIESYVHNLSTATDIALIGTQASLYAEYIGTDQNVYFGIATSTDSTTAPTDLNPTSTSTLVWYDDTTIGRIDSGYTHSNSSTSTAKNITLAAAGSYMVYINLPDEAAQANTNPIARVSLNGMMVTGGQFNQGYIANSAGVIDASLQWSGVVTATTTNEKLTVTTFAAGTSGTTVTVGSDQASIYIQQLPATGVYFSSATTTAGGTNWNPAAASTASWTNDFIKDTNFYTHSSTSSPGNVTVTQPGDYLLAFNDTRTGGTNSTNQIAQVRINGATPASVTGAQTKSHFIAAVATGQKSSGSLVYLLRNLAGGDVVSVTTIAEAAAATMTEDAPALLMLWHKTAQSSYIQDTERWYANATSTYTPTDPWPAGATDLAEGDSITSGVPVKSTDVMRLRLAMKANVTTSANTDSFKLQYAPGTSCSPALAWADVGATGSGTIWRGYHNSGLTAGTTLSSTVLSVSSTTETYEESNPSAVAPNAITVNTDGEWDWTLQDNGAAAGTAYCFRAVMANGQVLKDYNDYPQLITNAMSDVPTLITMFDNEKTASTTPWFTFTSSDDNGDDINYEIQVSSDPTFATTAIDTDSGSNLNDFDDVDTPGDKEPFTSSNTIRYKAATALTNGTTYWWRVRAIDPSGTNTYSSYSAAQSFTVDTSVTVSTWFQTTTGQFNNDTLSQVESTSTNDVGLSGSNTTGTIYSQSISYDSHTTGNSWGTMRWTNSTTSGTILYHVEYFTSTSSWALIPNTDLAGNAAGTSTQPINLAGLDPSIYSMIRARADLTKVTGTPRLNDWTISWALSVAQPTQNKPFDNEKVGTTTPTFEFMTTDPQGDALQYEVQWSTSATFASGVTTHTSGGTGWADISSSTIASPYRSGDTIDYTVQSGEALTNGTTYWWRVHAKDPSGGNAFSLWSPAHSLTVDTTATTSTWFQTTNEQFNSDTLTRVLSSGGDATAASDTGKIAIYRSAVAGETLTNSVFNNGWDTTVRQDNIYSLTGTTTLNLNAGYYAVMYGVKFSGNGTGTNRSQVQANLNVGGTNLPIGWSQGVIRRSGTATTTTLSGGGIINVASDGTALKLQSFLTDANPTAAVLRSNGASGIEVVKLDSAWPYERLSRSTKQTGPTSAGWINVTYNREDETNATYYTHPTGSASITLKQPGHYLVFANTYGSLLSGTSNDSMIDQKLALNGFDLEGSFTTVLTPGNTSTNGAYEGAASIGMIVQSTTTNQVLTVQLRRSNGTPTWTIDSNPTGGYVNRTGITIVKLPEADFIREQISTRPNLNVTPLAALSWDMVPEKDASWAYATATPSRLTALIAGDYLLFTGNYAATSSVASEEFLQGWRKNGGTLNPYGQATGQTNGTANTGAAGAWTGVIFPSVVNGDYFEVVTQLLNTAASMFDFHKSVTGLRIASLTEADTNAKQVESVPVVFSSGAGPKWSTFAWNDAKPSGTTIIYQVEYLNASSTYSLVPDAAFGGSGYTNSIGTTTSPIDISNLNRLTYGTLKILATMTCGSGNCPSLHDWTVKWSQGITISGTAKAYDQATNVTSGTVAVAVNGVLQSGKTGTISSGVWSIPNVTVFQDDVVTVFVSDATGVARAVAITKYIGTGNITGIALNQMHLTLNAASSIITNTDISQYDNSVSGTSAIFYDVDASNNLTVCAVAPCYTARLYVMSGATYEPNNGPSISVTTPHIQINGALIADGNTINVAGSWKNNAAFIKGSSTVVFTATSTTESVDSSTATSSAFYAVTFGQTSGTAHWNLINPIYASSTMSINFGTLQPGATSTLTLDGDLLIGASGIFAKNASTTFTGSGTNTWTDNTSGQDMGVVILNGSSKTTQLGSNVKATDVTINTGNTLDASASWGITVVGNWTNNNTFTARTGTVTFVATTTGKTITQGSSSFNNLTFNGIGGNWSFTGANATTTNDFTITNGTVTLPTATTTIGGSFDASAGTFMHNNGAIVFNSSASSKTINPGASTFYDLAFNGSGSWSLTANATSSRNTTITLGTVTAPSGVLAIGGSFAKNGGTFTHGSGTLRFFAGSAQTVKLGGSDAYSMIFDGVGGAWTFLDTNATTTRTFSLLNGSTTLPSGTFAVGGSFTNNGVFTHNSGTVKFNATTTGFTINPGSSSFYNLAFNDSSGGWTMTSNATSTHDTTIASAASLTVNPGISLAVGGTFSNTAPSATTWTNSTLYLYSGTSYSIDAKASPVELYGTLVIGANTNVRMWDSSSATTTIGSTGSLYSQNNANVNGNLYIWGHYTSLAGETWSYATDFDGTALGVGSRQANVRIASSSIVTLSTGTSTVVGISTASTTIDSQGLGAYALNISGGGLSAQYYQVRNTDTNGLNISNGIYVAGLSDGDFQLAQNGGTMMTIDRTVIDANPQMQIQRVRFATSTVVTGSSNVTEVGGNPTTGLFWWFRNSYGNFDGEASDSDPGGNPGYIQWDDSGFDVTISGRVYSDHGTTAIGNPPCDGSTQVITVVTNIGTTFTGSCAAGTGAYSIPHVTFRAGAVFAAYLNSLSGGRRGVTVTKSALGDLATMDIYQNAVILRHEDINPIANSDLTAVDSSFDSSIPFTISGGNMIVSPNTELYIWSGKTFAPAGNVTLQSGGSGLATDGRFYMATSSTFTEVGTPTLSIGGGLYVGTSSVFTAASSTITFTATTTGKSIYSASTLTMWNATFNGSGGQWSLDSTAGVATTTIQNALTLTAGTIAGTGDLVVKTGGVTGGGTFAMTGGTVRFEGTGSFGNSNAWQFKNLTLGTTTAGILSKTGSGTTTVSSVLTVTSSYTLNAGSGPWILSGSGTPFAMSGTFNVQTAPFTYSGTSATVVTVNNSVNYAALTLAPSGAGSPTYTFSGGGPTITSLTIGDGTNPVTVTADSNDPSIGLTGSMLINTSGTYIASNVGVLTVGGSWTNNGTFTHSSTSNGLVFNATSAGNTINAGSSSFYDVQFNGAGGSWTITSNATSTRNTTFTNANSITLSSGKSLEVDGTFSNTLNNASTTWTNATLFLNSGTSYSINAKANNGDTYGTLLVGASTKIAVWNSSAATSTVNATGSLYSQNDAGTSGALKIWGAYSRSSGTDYWSYATDFDGTDISGTPRKVNVSIASSSSIAFSSSAALSIIGNTTASTTIANQGAGAYTFSFSGASTSMSYYEFRNMDSSGVSISGSPTITGLSNGDFQLSTNGGSTMTIAGSVVTANPLLLIRYVRFATSTGITSGFNVTTTGSTATFWKFNQHYGNLAGESFDSDGGAVSGNPGYIHWDDSNDLITISGKVYSDEGTTVSSVCDNSTQVVRLKMEGAGNSYTSSCSSSTGDYSIPSVAFNPGDTMTVYLDTNGGKRAATVSLDTIANLSGVDLYENRVIVRHEGVNPMTITAMDQYDSDQDTDIPFKATLGAPNTLVLPPNTKLLVWTGKTFTPGGNVTLQSGSGTAYDGTLEVQSGGAFVAVGTQSHSIGGSFLLDTGATFTSANSTVTFTATTTGKTITSNSSIFYHITFNGSGGNWAFSGPATTTGDLTVTAGTLTLPAGSIYVGGSFNNSGGTFMHNNGTVILNATTTGKTIRANSSSFYNLTASSTPGGWTFVDTNATSSNDFIINAGSATLPSGIFAVGGSFNNTGGTFTSNNGTVKLTSVASGKNIQAGGSDFYNLTFDGIGGGWTFLDTNASSTRDTTIVNGTTTLPAGTFTIGGSFVNSGAFTSNSGTVVLAATTTGKSVTPGSSSFYNLTFNSAVGGWTITGNATSTHNTAFTNANTITLSSGKSLEVDGTFTNGLANASTTWTGSTLYLNAGINYAINARSSGGDTYATLLIGNNTQISAWNSSAATTTTGTAASLYSQNHAGVSGALYIFGAYTKSAGTDYWSYATDFDGTALGGGSRQVSVRIATSSSVAYSGATLNMVGVGTATTTVRASGTSAYPFSIAGGALTANYYEFRNVDSTGLSLSGTPAVSSLSNGYFELSAASGTAITIAGTVIDTNANLPVPNVGFATTSASVSGFNITLTGSAGSSWTFSSAYGNFAGEAHDLDGSNACGHIRWDDSDCQFVSESHYRWRNDDGGEGSPNSSWYSASWSKRQRIGINNPNAQTYTNLPVKITVPYSSSMLANFDDLRFTDSSGTGALQYWRESTTNSSSTIVWVKIPSIATSSSAVIYMYYGNSGATPSDNSSTFSFMEDFESNSLAAYTGSDVASFDTLTTYGHNGTYGLGAKASHENDRTNNGGIYRTGSQTGQGKTIRWFQYVNANSPTGGFDTDEPCTFFGVQGSAQNYAVCLEEFPTASQRVEIAKNVKSNDGSGTVLASTTVTYATGWYEVIVDWLTNVINVTVYNAAGSTFASLTKNDSTYAVGGMGFGFFSQHGGWDTYMVKPYTAVTPTYIFSAEQTSGGATWTAAEDTAIMTLAANQNVRLRFSIQNTGTATNQQYQLQYAPKGGALTCESVDPATFHSVPVAGSCGSEGACMTSSSQFNNLASTTPLMSYPGNLSYTFGQMIAATSSQSASLSVAGNTETEVEYNFQMTNNATLNSYCFRTSNNGADLANYDRVAEATMVHAPSITNQALNNARDIALTEGATTTIYATSTVTDYNGFADMVSATGTIYRSGVSGGASCTADNNNCYQIPASSCSFQACSGNSCTLSCRADIQYFAEPTDASSTYPSENWVARLSVQDTIGLRDTQSTFGVEMLTLRALRISTGNIDFGALANGVNTGAINATTTLANTGNSPIDVSVSGSDLNGTTDSIPVNSQKYATTTFTYGTCSICQLLTGSATPVSVNINKPTSTTTPQQHDVYWGITVPNGANAGAHSGTNTFTAVAPGG